MIAYHDFFPIKTGRFLSNAHEPLTAVVERANEWIASSQADVINVETVLLPNAESWGDGDSSQTAIRTSGEMSSYWYQIVRVWYRGR